MEFTRQPLNCQLDQERKSVYYRERPMGVHGARWPPRSSKPVVGAAEVATVGSTPTHSRCGM